MASDGAHIGFEGVEMAVQNQPGYAQDPLPPVGSQEPQKHDSRIAFADTVGSHSNGDDSELTPLSKAKQGQGPGKQVVVSSVSR